ncbi:hypothetical protein CIRMBP1230_00287 [Enterococcus cecorum]|nr:hypothetical protein CIRMBP1230_00287 [Enterococcus cecorum]
MRTDLFMNQEDQLNQEILNYLERMKFSALRIIFVAGPMVGENLSSIGSLDRNHYDDRIPNCPMILHCDLLIFTKDGILIKRVKLFGKESLPAHSDNKHLVRLSRKNIQSLQVKPIKSRYIGEGGYEIMVQADKKYYFEIHNLTDNSFSAVQFKQMLRQGYFE